MESKGTNIIIVCETKTARRAPLYVLGLGLAILLLVATVHTVWAQEAVDVYFEDLGYGSALSYVFTINSATQAPIGYRTVFFPQIPGYTTSFAWEQTRNILTLSFASYVDLIEITGYDEANDVLYFTRAPGYWVGCRSPDIPPAIPSEIVNYLCSSVSGR